MKIFLRGYHAEAANTPIREIIPAMPGLIPRVDHLVYTAGSSNHTLRIVRPLGFTNTTVSSQVGTQTLYINSRILGQTTAGVDEWVAASDYLIWQDRHGVFQSDTVASVSNGNILTMSNVLPSDVQYAAGVWACYEVARSTHQTLSLPSLTRTTLKNLPLQAGFPTQKGIKTKRLGIGDPMMVYIDNITNAGALHALAGSWVAPSNFLAG